MPKEYSMPTPSLARDFFDRFRSLTTTADRVAFIKDLVAKATPETDTLDFKTHPHIDLTNPKWREMWVEALAGFANNQGGVLVWGVDCHKDPDTKVDVAHHVQPVPNPAAVRTRLAELQRDATDPPVGNVEIEICEDPASAGAGYIICFVPDGPYKPYRTTAPQWQYIIRLGDSFRVMPRSVLQAMFYPRSSAVFRVTAQLSWKLGGKATAMRCEFKLVNDGTATARNTLVAVRTDTTRTTRGFRFSPGDAWTQYRRGTDEEFETSRSLHPCRVTHLFVAEWEAEHDLFDSSLCHQPAFEFTVYCENQGPQAMRIDFGATNMVLQTSSYFEAKAAE
jgi:hypothetical protein